MNITSTRRKGFCANLFVVSVRCPSAASVFEPKNFFQMTNPPIPPEAVRLLGLLDSRGVGFETGTDLLARPQSASGVVRGLLWPGTTRAAGSRYRGAAAPTARGVTVSGDWESLPASRAMEGVERIGGRGQLPVCIRRA